MEQESSDEESEPEELSSAADDIADLGSKFMFYKLCFGQAIIEYMFTI